MMMVIMLYLIAVEYNVTTSYPQYCNRSVRLHKLMPPTTFRIRPSRHNFVLPIVTVMLKIKDTGHVFNAVTLYILMSDWSAIASRCS